MHRFRTAREAASRACVITLLATSQLIAQNSTQVSVFGGVATDQVGQRSNAVGVAPTVTFATDKAGAQLGGNVTRFAAEAWSIGAATSFSAREPAAGPVGLTLRGAANASTLQGTASGTYADGELDPGLELRLRGATLFGGARAVAGSASQVTPVATAGLLPSAPGSRRTNVSRAGVGLSYGGVLSLLNDGIRSAAVSAREDRLTVTGIRYADRTAALTIINGGASLTAAGGIRSAPDERVAFGSATVVVPLAGPASLEISAGRYPSNRVLGTPAGQFMSVGMSLRFSGRRETEPTPSGAAPLAAGRTRLAIRAPDARRVDVAGDFSSWRTVPAQRAENGVWYVDLPIAPGRYRYAFRVNGSEWRVPDGATAVDDGFGGKSAWLDAR